MNHHGISWERGCEKYNEISPILNHQGKIQIFICKKRREKEVVKICFTWNLNEF